MPNPKIATPDEMFELVNGRRTDDPEWFTFSGSVLEPHDIVSILGSRLSERRRSLFERVLRERTNSAVVVVEGMVDLGNIGAVMRTADGFGIQNFHAVDTANAYKRSRRTSKGADKWLDRYRWTDPASCVEYLKAEGRRVIATGAGDLARPLDETDLTGRVAIVFGNELEGISNEMESLADDRVFIPMHGFSESLNISVAAAITLREVHHQRVARFGRSGDLPDDDLSRMRAVWYCKSVREYQMIVERALADGYRPVGT